MQRVNCHIIKRYGPPNKSSEDSDKHANPHSLARVFASRIHKVWKYSKTCEKRPLKNRQNKDLKETKSATMNIFRKIFFSF